MGEAANEPDEGQTAVAAVILNRLNSGKWGKSIPEVVLARHQFEPWSTQQGRSRMFGYAQDSQPYQRASAAFDTAIGGNDPTQGATHFFSPTAQATLGRRPPSWAQGEGQPIGGHTFYAPEGRVQMAQMQNRATGLPPGFQLMDDAVPASQGLPPGFQIMDEAPQAAPQPQPPQPEPQPGPTAGPVQRMVGNMTNVLPAATQGTSPNVDQYGKENLISAETFQGDDGSIQFRDPKTGQVIQTDNTKHVALRDPADNTVKIYARSAATNENLAVGVARVLSPGLMAGAPTARAAIPAAKNVTPKASDIFSTAKPAYREFQREASQIPVPPQAASAYGERIKNALNESSFIEELAPPVYSALKTLDTGGPVALDHLQKVKRVIGKSFNSPDKNVRDAASVASAELGKIMAEVSPTAAQNLKTADAIHSTARSVQDLQRKADVADLRAGRAGYGGNAVNSMRQVLSPIVQRAVEGKVTNLKPNEIAAMREIVEGNTLTNTLRGIGQLSPSKGIMQTAAAGGAMYGLGPAGLAIPAIGMASNKLATILTGKQIDRLKELVAKRSPAYSEAVAKSVERYEKAQMELINNPSPNRLAGYISASRILSSGLTRDGIQVSSGDLLRAIQAPVKSAAEGEEPAVPGRPGE